jgi:hypothetical protein
MMHKRKKEQVDLLGVLPGTVTLPLEEITTTWLKKKRKLVLQKKNEILLSATAQKKTKAMR